jgi:signal transduction histidine kinase
VPAVQRTAPRSVLTPFVGDLILTGVLLAIDFAVAAQEPPQASEASASVTFVVLLAASVPIAWRRSYPITALALTFGALLTHEILGYPEAPLFGPFVAIYAVGAHRATPVSTVAAGTAMGTYFVARIVNVARFGQPLITLLPNVTVLVLLWVLGATVRRTRDYAAQLEERAVQLEREREERARRAVEEERARIARELHDVVAHNVSIMVVQAGAARRVLPKDPKLASDALRSVEETGRNALVEMRRLLGVLRTEDPEGPGPLEPRPGAEGIPDLARTVREAGLHVDLVVEGERRDLPAGVGLSVYRIVQESLTNSLRHGGAAHARVLVRYGASDVQLEITDDGLGVSGPGARRDQEGRGLIGMRERAALLGGDFSAGPAPEGGFAVRARLPIEPAAT